MRFETIIACQFLVSRLEKAEAVRSIKDDGDVIQLVLSAGERLNILLIERGINLAEVRYQYETNSKAGIHSLMLLWVDMFLPHDGQETPLTDWMRALMGLHGEKIYGYEVAGREAFVFPIEFRGMEHIRRVHFGNIVNYAAIGGKKISTINPYILGQWLVGGFEKRAQGYRNQGIPQKDAFVVYFDILGVPSDADTETVKRAYRALARLYHPDVNKTEEADARMKRINLAYSKIMERLEP
jgi:hypothetical protein